MTEPVTEPAQPPSSKSNPQTKWDAGQTYVLRCFQATKKHQPAYLTAKNESNLSITVAPLDLHSGNASDDGPRFIKPASWDAMSEFLKRNKPWETGDLEAIRRDEEEDPEQNHGKPWAAARRYHEGNFMLHTLLHFAAKQPGLVPYFNDKLDDVAGPTWHYSFNSDKLYGWLVSFFLVNKDNQPHISAFLTNGFPLRNDVLSTGEVAVATGLIALRRCYHGFNGHRYIPVTIFSASDRQIRVVQAYHDREEPYALYVRRSHIMEFWHGARENWEDWTTLLCWMMGDAGKVE